MKNYKNGLKNKIKKHFNKSEIIELCFALGIDHEELDGGPKTQIIISLINYVERRKLFNFLLEHLRLEREDVDWQDPPHNPNNRSQQSPSRFYANVPFGMEKNFTGRTKELAYLDEWSSEDSKSPLCLIHAIGGSGKSSLAWYWHSLINDDESLNRFSRSIWWSFYDSEPDINQFIIELLSWFGDDLREFDNNRLRVNRLIDYLEGSPTLLILDGVERLLRLYRPDTYIELEQNTETIFKDFEDFDVRDFIDDVATNLLLRLSSLSNCKTLVTSRMIPSALEGQTGELLDGVQDIALNGLIAEDALAFFKKANIDTNLNEVKLIGKPINYHPQSLRLIVGYVSNNPNISNNLLTAVNYDPTSDLIAKREHILTKAYESLPKDSQELLKRIAVFQSNVTIKEISVIANPLEPPISERKFKFILYIAFLDIEKISDITKHLSILLQRGLLKSIREDSKISYSLHPIIKSYAYLKIDDPKIFHLQLTNYYMRQLSSSNSKERIFVDSSEFSIRLQVYFHLIASGYYERAFKFLINAISDSLRYQYANYPLLIRLIMLLMSVEDNHYTNLDKKADEANAILLLALCYFDLGQPHSALHLSSLAAQLIKKTSLWIYISSHTLISKCYLQLGLLKQADWHLRYGLALLEQYKKNIIESNNTSESIFEDIKTKIAIGKQELGLLHLILGNRKQAEGNFDLALDHFIEIESVQSQFVVYAYQTFGACLQNNPEKAMKFSQKAYEITNKRKNQADIIRGEWLRGWAFLLNEELQLAQKHLDTAINKCRAKNYIQLEPKILLALARLESKNGQIDSARKTALEALLVATKAQYGLDLADIYNFLAEVELGEENFSEVINFSEKALAQAFHEEPPFVYHSALIKAENLKQQAE